MVFLKIVKQFIQANLHDCIIRNILLMRECMNIYNMVFLLRITLQFKFVYPLIQYIYKKRDNYFTCKWLI